MEVELSLGKDLLVFVDGAKTGFRRVLIEFSREGVLVSSKMVKVLVRGYFRPFAVVI